MNLCGVLLVRKEYKGRLSAATERHEAIHTAQMKEMLYIGFYVWYITEWLIRVLFTKDAFKLSAYMNISFEREAYIYSQLTDPEWIMTRPHFFWWRFLWS